MSRRSSSSSETLFPFLDVLVSTMGALLLFLLVLTRHVRQQEGIEMPTSPRLANVKVVDALPALKFKMTEAVSEVAQPIAQESETSDDFSARIAAQLDQIEDRLHKNQQRWQAFRKQQQELDAEKEAQALSWKKSLDKLQQSQTEIEQRTSALRKNIAQQATASRVQGDERSQLESLLHLAEEKKQTVSQQQEKIKKETERTVRQFEELLEQLEQAEQQPVSQTPPRFEIVAYDGVSGTRRRPVLIECRHDGLYFASERIFLSAKMLDGYAPESNPLLAGTAALIDYWTERDARQSPDEPAPYVLLVVRPRGTVGFYVARKLLEKMDTTFGYELIESDDQIRWPDPDQGAVEACQNAINQAMANRSRQLATRPSLGRDSHQVSDPNGGFFLAELEQLKRSSASGVGLGEEWVPDRSRLRRNQDSDLRGSDLRGRGHAGLADRGATGNFPENVNGRSTTSPPQESGFGRGSGSNDSSQQGDGQGFGEGLSDSSRSTPGDFASLQRNHPNEGFADGNETGLNRSTPGSFPQGGLAAIPDGEMLNGAYGPEGSYGGEEGFNDRFQSGQTPSAERGPLDLTERPEPQLIDARSQSSFGRSSQGTSPRPPRRGLEEGTMSGAPQPSDDDFNSHGSLEDSLEYELRKHRRSRGIHNPYADRSEASDSPRSSEFQLPPPPGTRARSVSTDGGRNRQWGRMRPGGVIGIERDVVIQLYQSRVVIGETVTILVDTFTDHEIFQLSVADAIDRHVMGWGTPPESFMWRPLLKVEIYPGGNQHYPRIQELITHWGLTSTMDYKFEEPLKTLDDAAPPQFLIPPAPEP